LHHATRWQQRHYSKSADVVKRRKENFADAEIGFIDAGISDCSAWMQYRVINAAKAKLASEDENHIYIDTIAEGLKYNGEPGGAPDIYHFDSASEVKLGHLFARELIANFLETE
jgi:hypothetical protein